VRYVRTPDERFANLPGWPYAPRWVEVDEMRMHHVDEGPPDAPPVLLLHGEPTWGYLYRTMIPILTGAGHRVLVPDLPGFGRSDKPVLPETYSYVRIVSWMASWLAQVDLRDITLVCQDWGSLVGLRLVAEHPDRFARVVVANGGLPTGDRPAPRAFRAWQAFARHSPVLPAGWIVRAGTRRHVPRAVAAAYDAPFPSEAFRVGARMLPSLVPTRPDDPASADNRRAWEVLATWTKPFLTAFSDGDPITRGLDRAFRERIPGAAGEPHATLRGAGHFLQEDRGEELARVVIEWMGREAHR
jgi:haloalkane dehalogenase